MFKLPKLIVIAAIAAGSFVYTAPANANDQLAMSICEYIAADDKNRLRSKLKSSRVKIRNIYDAVQCNGNNLLRHAVASNAIDSGEYIVKNLSKSALEDGVDIAWAETNHAGSPLIAIIKERAGL
jgi:NADH dehydrogenase FAD-containing subunit